MATSGAKRIDAEGTSCKGMEGMVLWLALDVLHWIPFPSEETQGSNPDVVFKATQSHTLPSRYDNLPSEG